MIEPQGEQSNEKVPLDTESIPFVSFAMIVHSFVDKPSEDEPPVKKLKFFILDPSIPLPIPLSSFTPQDLKQKAGLNLSIKQFTNSLFQLTSSDFSPTPSRDESKGKGIAIEEEPLKQLIPQSEQSGPDPKITNLDQFCISGKTMTLEDAQAQLAEIKKLADLKVEQEKTKKKLKKLSSAEIQAQA
uniref:Uncharacterized protein n=1 Tax=Tanacetum cinerariifolium TaxID=118510 RepID=A0A6L2L8S2_TANCI|nr:hypothetical protein [Tanacetum cinerariifolium]